MNSSTSKTILESFNYKVVTLNNFKQTWRITVNFPWIVQNVLLYRAFSNFWLIPNHNWNSSMKKIISFMSNHENEMSFPIILKFQSTPVIAIPTI